MGAPTHQPPHEGLAESINKTGSALPLNNTGSTLIFSSQRKYERTFEELDVLLINLGVFGLDQRYGPEDVPLCTTERNVKVGQQPRQTNARSKRHVKSLNSRRPGKFLIFDTILFFFKKNHLLNFGS
jgi:hypothetical protein